MSRYSVPQSSSVASPMRATARVHAVWLVADDLDALALEDRDDARHRHRGDGVVDDEALDGVAHAGALALRVHDDGQRHLQVGVLVHVDVAVADAGLDRGHLGVLRRRT